MIDLPQQKADSAYPVFDIKLVQKLVDRIAAGGSTGCWTRCAAYLFFSILAVAPDPYQSGERVEKIRLRVEFPQLCNLPSESIGGRRHAHAAISQNGRAVVLHHLRPRELWPGR